MRFFDRNRRVLTLITLLAFVFGLGASANPASAYYNPKLGRFMSADPNGQAILVTNGLSYHARNPTVTISMAYELQFGDGMNFYEYLTSNPKNNTDPSGLAASNPFDFFAEADHFEEDWQGQRLYTLSEINESARWASVGLKTTLDIASGIMGIDVFDSVAVIADGRGGFWEAMDIVFAVSPIGRVVKAADRLNSAAKFAVRTRRGIIAVDTARGLSKLARRVSKNSASFKQTLRQAKNRYPKKAGREEFHHIIPKYLGGPPDGPTLKINAAYHQLITNAFRREYAYGRVAPPTAKELREIVQRVYNHLPLPK